MNCKLSLDWVFCTIITTSMIPFFGVAGVFVCLHPVGTILLMKGLEAISRVRSNICLSIRWVEVIHNYLLQIEFVVEKKSSRPFLTQNISPPHSICIHPFQLQRTYSTTFKRQSAKKKKPKPKPILSSNHSLHLGPIGTFKCNLRSSRNTFKGFSPGLIPPHPLTPLSKPLSYRATTRSNQTKTNRTPLSF